MTAGALQFWQKHAEDRQTIAYAVSVDHAHNLAAVFNDAGVPAAVILGDTNREERDKAIAGFREGSIKVLVNVAVATEGFDLPDASCIIIARPTMSLALYLQMVVRGLRPKPNGGDCLILDLAANSVTHGLPEDYRKWSLEPRGTQKPGEAPVVICPLCEAASPAASHNCRMCGFSFGKDCDRCGRWRARRRWIYENECGDSHQRVCDLCHIDAHIQAHLPVMPPLDELVELYDPEDEMTFPTDVEIDDDLAIRLSALFGELLEAERQSIAGADDARREELRQLIEWRELVLADNGEQAELFQEHIAALPEEERPDNLIQQGLMIADWVRGLESELAAWRDELTELERRAVDKEAIFNSAQNKAEYLLRHVAAIVELLPDVQSISTAQTIQSDSPQYTQIVVGEPKRFYIGPNNKGIFAECDFYNEKKIVVRKDSTATRNQFTAAYGSYRKRKEQLITDGVLVEDGPVYRFARDYEFPSANAVSTVVLGNTGAGKSGEYLKDANGVPFARYYPK